MRTAEAPTKTTSSAINSGVAVVVLGYQTTISSGRSLCGSGRVVDWKPRVSAKALADRMVRSRVPRAVFNAGIFLELGGGMDSPAW